MEKTDPGYVNQGLQASAPKEGEYKTPIQGGQRSATRVEQAQTAVHLGESKRETKQTVQEESGAL